MIDPSMCGCNYSLISTLALLPNAICLGYKKELVGPISASPQATKLNYLPNNHFEMVFFFERNRDGVQFLPKSKPFLAAAQKPTCREGAARC
jgi:hypothetical protein